MANVYHLLQYHGDRIIYIYGELDPWSATGIRLIGRTDAVKFVVKNGHHGSRVRDFSPEQKELFYSTLERWLGLNPARQQNFKFRSSDWDPQYSITLQAR